MFLLPGRRLVELPAPVMLAVWVGAWSIVPAVGVVVGSLAVGLIAIPESFSLAGWLMVIFVGYQVFDAVVLEKRIDRATLHLGSFGTFVAAAFGPADPFVEDPVTTRTPRSRSPLGHSVV